MTGGTVYAANQGVYRGDYAVIEVDENSPMTAIPDTGTWYNGPLNTDPQQYDVLVAARGNISTAQNPTTDLIVTPYEIPDFFETKNGKLLVAEPKPMGALSMPKGHSKSVTIELKTINGKDTTALTDIEQHVCLGLRMQGTSEYLDILRTEHMSTMAGLSDTENLELVPLLSKSASEYIAIEPRTEYPPSDSDYKPSGQFNFGSVFRTSAAVNNSNWIKNQPHNNLENPNNMIIWKNYGSLYEGPVTTQDEDSYDKQLLVVRTDGQLARSPDGVNWFQDMGNAGNQTSGWDAAPVYGNGVWCIVHDGSGDSWVKRSTDGGKTWAETLQISAFCLTFGNGIFMAIITNGSSAYTSTDALNWTQIEAPGYDSRDPSFGITYGDNKWICPTSSGKIFRSLDDGKTWEKDCVTNLSTLNTGYTEPYVYWGGICYANGYFYIIEAWIGLIARSLDGLTWEKVAIIQPNYGPSIAFGNISLYKNKLYVLKAYDNYSVGIFNPDGTIDLEFDENGDPI